MTESSGVKARIKRCAVCKIDLKGRFVYIDDGIEKILGYTKEELFGKTFRNFLKDSDHDLIKQLLAHRNHFETYFETANIHLVNRHQQVIPATLVISLNFIAGNPVNYQIIINAGSLDKNTEMQTGSSNAYQAFFQDCLGGVAALNHSELVCLIRTFTGAEAAFIYRIDDEALTLDAGTIPFESEKANPGPLHIRVACSKGTYSFADQDNVRTAVEQEGLAPAEFVCRLECHDPYLLRLVFNDDLSAEVSSETHSRAHLAAQMATLILDYEKSGSETGFSGDVDFTLHFLNTLGVGALITDRDGMIRDKNPMAIKMLGAKNLSGHYRELVEFLAADNSPDITRSFTTFIDLEGDNKPVDFDIVVNLPGGHKTLLTIYKQALPGEDNNTCLLFSPLALFNQESSSRAFENKLLTLLVNEIKTGLKTAAGFSEKLSHEYYNHLNSEGNFYLLCLHDNLTKLGGLLAHLLKLLSMNNDIEVPRLTDLSLVVSQVLQELQTVYPGVTIDIKMNDLPKIRTWRNKVIQILRDVLSSLIRFADRTRLSVSFNAKVMNNQCEIVLLEEGTVIQEKYRQQFFDCYTSLPVKNSVPGSDRNSEPAFIKQMVASFGGKISLETQNGIGNRITLLIPIIND